MNLENDLRRVLERQSPPPGFASRVMATIERGEPQRRRPVWWRAAAASVLLASVLVGYTVHQRREGERAKEQLLTAMKIANEKVRYAQSEVRGIGNN